MSAKVVPGISDDDLLQVMHQLHEELLKDEKEDGEFTTNEYAEANNLSRGKARNLLMSAEKKGLVTKRVLSRSKIYWRVK